MPTFPTDDSLPRCLNVFNPTHHALFLYWLFFHPSSLKIYLYQIDKELFFKKGLAIFRTLIMPAYLNFYLIALVQAFFLPSMVILLFWSFETLVLQAPVSYIFKNLDINILQTVTPLMNLAVMFKGMAVGVAVVVAFGVAGGVAVGVAIGVAFGVAFGVAVVVAFGVAYGVAGGVAYGVAYGVALGVAYGVAFGVAYGVAFGVAVGVAGGVAVGVAGGVAVGVAVGVGSSRAIFYPWQWIMQQLNLTPQVIYYDEYLILPITPSRTYFEQQWKESESETLLQLAHIAANPFQRYQAQRILFDYYFQKPLPLLYQILQQSDLETYAILPVTSVDTKRFQDKRVLLLSELACFYFSVANSFADSLDKWVWKLTKHLRYTDSNRVLITKPELLLPAKFGLEKTFNDFKTLLLNKKFENSLLMIKELESTLGYLYTRAQWKAVGIIFILYKARPDKLKTELNGLIKDDMSIVSFLTLCPYGDEIANSLIAFKDCLNIQQLEAISQQHKSLTQTPINDNNLRPKVIQAQHQLARASRDIQAYCDATSRQNKLAAIARSLDTLETLEQNIKTLHQPEQKIIQAIIDHWQPLLTAQGGTVGRFSIEKPIENPYVAGNPVTGKLFVGRDDIFRELESLWMSKNPASVVLYGHRRMGKTSILHNLGCRFGDQKHIIDFNLQRIRAKTLQSLLYQLADSCYLKTKKIFKLSKPQSADFADDPYYSFDCFLQEINEQQTTNHYEYLIVTLDEFENLEIRINDGTLDKGLLEYFRSVIQTYPWFILVFAGLHTLDEMRKDYFNPLFGSIKTIKVSFLENAPARLLITEPAEDFPLDYDQNVIDEIIRLTHGQAYLIQQICHNLLSLYNEQKFDQSQQRADRFSIKDLEMVLTESRFFQDSDYYFTGVWGQADEVQKQVLIQLAQADIDLNCMELTPKLDMDPEMLTTAIDTLQKHDVIALNQDNDSFQIKVPLMQQWINTLD
ncbi:ATP-binding protein [Candidatus Albibeggiatoa sp. nov. BB20]|uniref:ATP-binding protein n=1 Tax=Candidatus Albibeggiatoa sp. nov. BB20 TaxID=3162723 RepID=UPI0033656A07